MTYTLSSLPRRACSAWATLAALALAAPLAAQAEVRGSVHLQNFGWSVVDLDPNDGVAASATFYPWSFESGVRAGVTLRGQDALGQPLPYSVNQSRTWAGNALFTNAGRSLSLAGTQAAAAMGGPVDSHRYGFRLDGLGSREAVQARDYSRFETASSLSSMVLLAPNTELVWTGQLSLSIEKTGAGAGMRHERGRAYVNMHMESEDPIFEESYHTVLDTFGRAPGRLSHEESLSFVFRNYSPYETPASFEMSLGTYGYSSANPVPEPGAVGLMLAGVGVVGFVARRRASPRPLGSAG